MKHAGEVTLDKLEPLLDILREVEGIKEKGRGKFYCKSSAFLHFHEDPAGIFADLKQEGKWTRYDVTKKTGQRALISQVKRTLKS